MSLFTPIPPSPWTGRYQRVRPTLSYLAETEAHVYALAVAACVLLSFYPFLIVILTFCRDVLRWPAAVEAIYLALNDFLPGEVGAFIRRNIQFRGSLQVTSMVVLLITANGIFEPLEVALNRAWGVKENRSYLRNQLISLGMIFLCGGLALLSLMLTATNQAWVSQWAGQWGAIESWINVVLFKLAALPISILALFFIYWLLPNRKVEARKVAPVAIMVGLVLEALKYVQLLVWPLFGEKLRREYGVFYNSATILLWSFIVAMIILAGAHWAAQSRVSGPSPDTVS
jgi:membrane protein